MVKPIGKDIYMLVLNRQVIVVNIMRFSGI